MNLDLSIKRPALRYHGSKFRLAAWIIGFFPPHASYCEPFGGGAGVLLRKPRVLVETYNDLDSDVVNFFRVLRDDAQRTALLAAIELTPFAREEYRACFEPTSEPVERARRLICRAQMGFGSHSHNIANRANGFRTLHYDGKKYRHCYARELFGLPENLLQVAQRFAGVTIEHCDALECIQRYDAPDCLFYCDPPYPESTRHDGSKGYAHEMSDADHRRLAWLLRKVKGKVVLSGYQCALYAELFADWHRAERRTMANGQFGASPRVESLWLNFTPRTDLSDTSNP